MLDLESAATEAGASLLGLCRAAGQRKQQQEGCAAAGGEHHLRSEPNRANWVPGRDIVRTSGGGSGTAWPAPGGPPGVDAGKTRPHPGAWPQAGLLWVLDRLWRAGEGGGGQLRGQRGRRRAWDTRCSFYRPFHDPDMLDWWNWQQRQHLWVAATSSRHGPTPSRSLLASHEPLPRILERRAEQHAPVAG